MEIEELLNKIIEKGWKPRNKEETRRLNYHTLYREVISLEFDNYNLPVSYSIRDLVSRESGLRQFVCENELVKPVVDIISICSYSHFTDDHEDCGWDETFPEYRLIESALKEEGELEDFLLSNIVIKDEE